MKHHKLIALVLAATLLLTACAASEPELVRYDHPTGLSLTMWEGFEGQDAEGFVGGYINQDQGIAILMAEELFASLANVGIDPEMTLEEYGRFLMDCYGLEGTVESDALGHTDSSMTGMSRADRPGILPTCTATMWPSGR